MKIKQKKIVNTRNVVCSGPDAPHDHPIVYYIIPEHKDFVICFYCSCKFVYKEKRKRKKRTK